MIFSVVFSTTHAATIQEIQEVRLAKIELAVADKNYAEAMRLIDKNITSKYFHLDTFLFLADFHYKRGDYAKAFRVYYYIISKIHDPLVTELKDIDQLESSLKEIPKASAVAQGIYFKLATRYYQIFKTPRTDKEIRNHVLELSAKYFKIARYYGFNLSQTNLYLGLIQGYRRKHSIAVDRLLEAQILFEKNPKRNRDNLNTAKVLIGDNLVRSGRLDAGAIYLRSIYFADERSGVNDSLKEYANTYLDALSSDYVTASFGYESGYNSNPSRNSQKDVLTLSDPNAIDSTYDNKTLNIYYITKNRKRDWSFTTVMSMSELLYKENSLDTNDSRSITGSFQASYDNLLKSILKVSYSYSFYQYKPSTGDIFTKLLYSDSLTFQYTHTLKKGTLTYKIPYSKTTTVLADPTTSVGLTISYTPLWKNKIFAPSYSIGVKTKDELANVNKSLDLIFSLSNHFKINPVSSLFLSVYYVDTSNDDPDLAEYEFNTTLYYSRVFKKIRGLSGNIKASMVNNRKENGEDINGWSSSLGLTYSF